MAIRSSDAVTNRRTAEIVSSEEEPRPSRLRIAQFRDAPGMADMRLRQPPWPLPDPDHRRLAPDIEDLAKLFLDKRNKIAAIQSSQFGRP